MRSNPGVFFARSSVVRREEPHANGSHSPGGIEVDGYSPRFLGGLQQKSGGLRGKLGVNNEPRRARGRAGELGTDWSNPDKELIRGTQSVDFADYKHLRKQNGRRRLFGLALGVGFAFGFGFSFGVGDVLGGWLR